MAYNGRDVQIYHADSKVSASNPLPVSATLSGTIASSGGRSKVAILRNDYASVNVTTGAYVQLTASTASIINHIQIFDSSGSVLVLATGSGGSEIDQMYIFPGGNGPTDLLIPAGTRVSIKAVDASATAGQFLLNCFS